MSTYVLKNPKLKFKVKLEDRNNLEYTCYKYGNSREGIQNKLCLNNDEIITYDRSDFHKNHKFRKLITAVDLVERFDDDIPFQPNDILIKKAIELYGEFVINVMWEYRRDSSIKTNKWDHQCEKISKLNINKEKNINKNIEIKSFCFNDEINDCSYEIGMCSNCNEVLWRINGYQQIQNSLPIKTNNLEVERCFNKPDEENIEYLPFDPSTGTIYRETYKTKIIAYIIKEKYEIILDNCDAKTAKSIIKEKIDNGEIDSIKCNDTLYITTKI